MRVLLPPSETKRPDGGNNAFGEHTATLPPYVLKTHERVLRALIDLSQNEDIAAKALKLGVKSRGEVAHNLRLNDASVLPAIERYTGVLFDAINAETMPSQARAWLGQNVWIQSALFGLIPSATPIPPYRLSATTRLPALDGTLKRVWNAAYPDEAWGDEFTLDLRSNDYAALAPLPKRPGRFVTVHVAERSADGIVRPLNHFNKRAKGLFVRDLAESFASGVNEPESVSELSEWGRDAGWDILTDDDPARVTVLQRVR